MEIINGYNGGLRVTPQDCYVSSNNFETYNVSGGSNKIYFFTDKSIIDNNVLYNINDEADLLSTFSENYVGSITGFGLDFLYNTSLKKRIIKQNPIDALRFTNEINGTIEWCAIRVATGKFIFSDEIGTFDVPSSVNLNQTNVTAGDESIMNSLKFEIRDLSDGELV